MATGKLSVVAGTGEAPLAGAVAFCASAPPSNVRPRAMARAGATSHEWMKRISVLLALRESSDPTAAADVGSRRGNARAVPGGEDGESASDGARSREVEGRRERRADDLRSSARQPWRPGRAGDRGGGDARADLDHL